MPDKVKSIADIKKQLLGLSLGLGLGSIIVAVDNCKLSGIQWYSYPLLLSCLLTYLLNSFGFDFYSWCICIWF